MDGLGVRLSAHVGYKGETCELWGLRAQAGWERWPHFVTQHKQGDETYAWWWKDSIAEYTNVGVRAQEKMKRSKIKSLNKMKRVSIYRMEWQLRQETGYICGDWGLDSLKTFTPVYSEISTYKAIKEISSMTWMLYVNRGRVEKIMAYLYNKVLRSLKLCFKRIFSDVRKYFW